MQEVLAHYKVSDSDRLGGGGEADVFALDDSRVLRVHKPGMPQTVVSQRRELLDDLNRVGAKVPFRIPNVLEVSDVDGVQVSIEERLPGQPMHELLGTEIEDRRGLIRSYLAAAKQVGDLSIERQWYGDLLREEPIHTRTFLEYALARVHDNFHDVGSEFRGISELAIADALSECPMSLVHMDIFPGNVMIEDNSVAAILDFSVVCLMGDRRIDPIAAAAYLDPEITPTATDEDRGYARTWLEANELLPMYEPVKRFLAAFWLPAVEDKELSAWCRRVLLEDGS